MNITIKILMIGIMTISGTFGALYFKKAITKLEGTNIYMLICAPELYVGVCFYLLGALLNIILLRYIDYTILYPMTSLTYIWTMVVSYIVLKEKINREKLLAVLFIVLGIIVLSLTN